MALLRAGFILLTVILLSIGQILFKMASNSLDFSFTGLVSSLLNTRLIIAMFVYFLATMMWLFVLKETPLRSAYPFFALAFFIVPVLSHFLLNEALSWNIFVGAILIAIGVCVSVYQ